MKVKTINNKAKDKYNKLICNLVEDLIDVVNTFAKVHRNKNMNSSQEVHILVNSVHAFYNAIISKIYCIGVTEKDRDVFLQECNDLHTQYMNQLKEKYNATHTGEKQSS